MEDGASFKDEGFENFLSTEGTMILDMMGQKDEIPYKANCFINSKRTIGYVEMMSNEGTDWIFISKTASGGVMTLPGEEDGIIEVEVEGLHSMMSAATADSVEAFYAMHLEALKDEDVLADEDWLKEQVPRLPQRLMDAMAVIMAKAMEVMTGVVESMGKAMEGVMENVMAPLAEGMGSALNEGLADLANGPSEAEAEGDGVKAGGTEEVVEAKDAWTCPACGKDIEPEDERCKHCGEGL